MPEPAAIFISAAWIKPLWKQLSKIRGDRKKEVDAMGNDFGDPVTLARYYIEPHCQHHNPADHDERDPISFVRSPVFETINHFLGGDFVISGDGKSQLFVLSDAGMGKTSLLLMLKLTHLMSFWPKGYNCALFKCGDSTLASIAAIKDRASTVLLLDALDEDPTAWGRISERLQELLSETATFRRVIVSCRTQFFPEDAADPFGLPGRIKVTGFMCPTLYLSLFDDTQVNAYLRKRFPKRWYNFLIPGEDEKVTRSQAIIERMDSLRFRPLLLAHIDYIIDSDAKIWNDYTVYLALVESWLLREQRKHFLARPFSEVSEQLLKACIFVAASMSLAGERVITVEEIRRLIASHVDVEQLNHVDIGGRSLLNRRSDGAYRFSHYTIQEFLIVHGFILDLLAEPISCHRVTDQMLRFFLFACSSGIEVAPARIQEFTSLVEEADLRGLDLGNLKAQTASLRGAKLAGAVLEGADLRRANLSGATLHRANLQSADLSEADLTGSDLREANCQRANFGKATLQSANLRGAILRQADMSSALLADVLINAEDLIGAVGMHDVSADIKPAGRLMNNFTPRAQQVLALARKEAERLRLNEVGTGPLALGLIRIGAGVATNVLIDCGIDQDNARRLIESRIKNRSEFLISGSIPYTPRVKKVLALAGREAKALNHSYLGTEHILLGILREGEGDAARVLLQLGLTLEVCRKNVLKQLDPSFSEDDTSQR